MIVGMFSRPAAISCPGVVLSQEARQTMPSSSAPSTATSMSEAIRSRDGRMYCPAAPAEVIASDGAAVRTSNATPPAASMAVFSGATISSRWLKQDASCEEELTIAIFGFSRSSSESPSADHCARRIAHGVVPGVKLERSFRSGTPLSLVLTGSPGKGVVPAKTSRCPTEHSDPLHGCGVHPRGSLPGRPGRGRRPGPPAGAAARARRSRRRPRRPTAPSTPRSRPPRPSRSTAR